MHCLFNSELLFIPRFKHTLSKCEFFSRFSRRKKANRRKKNVSNKNCTFYANFWSHQSELFTFVYSKLVNSCRFRLFEFNSPTKLEYTHSKRALLFYSDQVFFVATVTNSTQLLAAKEKSQISASIHIYKYSRRAPKIQQTIWTHFQFECNECLCHLTTSVTNYRNCNSEHNTHWDRERLWMRVPFITADRIQLLRWWIRCLYINEPNKECWQSFSNMWRLTGNGKKAFHIGRTALSCVSVWSALHGSMHAQRVYSANGNAWKCG